MKIGKVQGRTLTEFNDQSGIFLRKLTKDGRTRLSIPNYLTSDTGALIAQWISAIDKVYNKPIDKNGNAIVPPKEWYDARDALGQAFWLLAREQYDLCPDVDSKRFFNRLRPYGDSYEQNFKGAKNSLEGRWFKAMSVNGSTPEDIARALFDHLHLDEKRIDGKSKKNPVGDDTADGFLRSRAKSIETSVVPRSIERLKRNWGQKEVKAYLDAHPAFMSDMYEAICKPHKEQPPELKERPRLKAKVGYLMSEHLARVQGSKRCEYNPDDGPSVLALHHDIKLLFKRLCARGKGAQKYFPKTNDELKDRLDHTHANRVLNQLHREGRVQKYHGSAPDLENSYYWTSQGQTEIKESEVFVRLWGEAFAHAVRAAKAWIDPDGKIINGQNADADITSGQNIQSAVNDADLIDAAVDKLSLYFGEAPELSSLSLADKRTFVFAMLSSFRSSRNHVFHLSTRGDFIKNLKRELRKTSWHPAAAEAVTISPELQANIYQFISHDAANLGARMLADLDGAFVPHFSSRDDFEKLYLILVNAETDAPEVSSGLPKFKHLLSRAEGVDTYLERDLRLPAPATGEDLEDSATKARYTALLRIYEGPFRAYASAISGHDLQAYSRSAKDLATSLAKKANANKKGGEDIEGRSSKLRHPQDDETLREYLSALTGETATEFRVQVGYESNPGQAKEQAEFIENYRRDILADMFATYLKDRQFGWVLDIKPGAEPLCEAPVLPAPVQTGREFDFWQAMLYLVLHFIPANQVSRLLHQLRKWDALQGKFEFSAADQEREAHRSDAKEFRDVLSLFLKTGDGRFVGESVTLDLSQFREFFDNPETFDRLFMVERESPTKVGCDTSSGSTGRVEHRTLQTIRGLRQIARYSHLKALRALFEQNKITDSEVAELEEMERQIDGESQVARAQVMKARLHKALAGQKSASEGALAEYREAVDTIKRHRFLVSRVYLGDFLRLHGLKMDILSRLIDYAGSYQRDVGKFIHDATEQRKEEHSWITPISLNAECDRTNIRNDLAHFNVLDCTDADFNITALLNRVRQMMSYDRKRKNSVVRSIIDLLDREGIEISWKMVSHSLTSAKLSQKAIKHLSKTKGAEILEDRYSEDYMKYVARIFGGELERRSMVVKKTWKGRTHAKKNDAPRNRFYLSRPRIKSNGNRSF